MFRGRSGRLAAALAGAAICAVVFAGVAPAAAKGSATPGGARELIESLGQLDGILAKLKKKPPKAGSDELATKVIHLAGIKKKIISADLGGRSAYGVTFSVTLLKLDCADSNLLRARFELAAGSFRRSAQALERAKKCLDDLRAELKSHGAPPPGMVAGLDAITRQIDDTVDTLRKLEETATPGGKFHLIEKGAKELERDMQQITGRKIAWVINWWANPMNQNAVQPPPTAFGVGFFDLLVGLDGMDANLIKASYAHNRAGVVKGISDAIRIKESLITKLRATNPESGNYVTFAKGAEFTRICVYIKGPANETGRVTLAGAGAIKPPNPSKYTLSDQGNDMVSFLVLGGSGAYAITIQRDLPNGNVTNEAATTSVPASGQADAVPPPAGQGYGTQPCPKPTS